MEKDGLDLGWADIVTSVMILLLSTFMGGWLEGLGRAASGPGFFASLLNAALMFFAAFALGDIASTVYWRFRGEKRVEIASSDMLQVVAIGAALLSLGILYSIVKELRAPYLSHVLAVLTGSAFGFSFGAEMKLESAGFRTDQIRKNRDLFDHSLKDNLPYALLLFAYVFPLDFLLERGGRFDFITLLFLGLLFASYVYLAGRLAGKGLGKMEIRLKNNGATILVVSALSLGSMFGFIYWDMTATRDLGLESESLWMRVFVLFFFGLVPVRMAPLLFLKEKNAARIVSVLSLAYYVARKIQLF